MQNSFGVLATVNFADVCGVAFLPKELACTQKDSRAKFPTNNVGPLIQQQWKIAIALHPLREHRINDGLRGRTHHQSLLKRLATTDRDHGALGGKALDVLRLF